MLENPRLDDLEQVVLCGNVQVSVQAMHALLRRGVETVLLNRGGAHIGRLTSGRGKQVELRRSQFRQLEQPEHALDLARRVVAGKLRNQRALLRRYQRSRRDERIARALVSIRLLLERVDGAPDLDHLRGLEGKAAADYFGAFPALVQAPGITFDGRKRRPPPDPVNILLSFGYTLLCNQVQGMVETAGLDPYLGALHAPAYGRPSLALDLMEEQRPVLVDAAVLRVINTGAITPRDFMRLDGEEEAEVEETWEREELDAEGEAAPPPRRKLLLTHLGSRKWFSAYERRLNEQTYYPPRGQRLSYRQVLREQVYLLARHLKGEEAYVAYQLGASG